MTDTNMNVSSITAQRGHVQALAFAAKGGAALSALLTNIAIAKETESLGPINMFAFLENHFVDDERNSIPVPGSKKEDSGNKPYDRYTVEVGEGGNKKRVPGSWYTDVIANTQAAKDIDQEIEWLDGGEGMPEHIRNMGTATRKERVLVLRKRKANMRQALSRGAMLWLHIEQIGQINPERIRVKPPVRENAQTRELEVYGPIIRLQDPAGELEDKYFTATEFLRLDPDKLEGPSEKQTIATLEATNARAPRGNKKAGKGAQDIKPPSTIEGVLNMMNVMSTALDQQTPEGEKLVSKLLAAIAQPGERADDIVETIGDWFMAFDEAVWSVMNARYNQIKRARSSQKNVAAATAKAS